MKIITIEEKIGATYFCRPHAKTGNYMLEVADEFFNCFQILLSSADGSNTRSALVYNNEISSADNLTAAQKRTIFEFAKEYKKLKCGSVS